MKSKEIADRYGLDSTAFVAWLKTSGYKYKQGVMGGFDVDESQDIQEVVRSYKQFQVEEQQRQEQEAARIADESAQRAVAEQQKQQWLASMLITSGFNFDGYTITKYSGYISGDDAVQMDRPSHGWMGGVHGNVGEDLMVALAHIRRNALAELKEAAYALGCNAVIGVDFDYITLDPETVNNQGGTLYLPFLFAVTANGNAVVIEQNDGPRLHPTDGSTNG